MKKILFLSGLDFKEKSIQVIRKTPEAFAQAGWSVDYIVARDNLENGNYSYEDEIYPSGINVLRIYWPLSKLRYRSGRYIGLVLGKLASLWVIITLAVKAYRLLRSCDYDVVYGYELQGVLAMNLLRPFFRKSIRLVSRFQGTFLNEMLIERRYLRLFFNIDLLLAIRLNSNLMIMTNDGTQGDQAVIKIKKQKKYDMAFWINGVDYLPIESTLDLRVEDNFIFMSVSRLVGWKRVDRNLKILFELKKLGHVNFIYYVLGDGFQRPHLEQLANDLDLARQVFFVGAIKHKDVVNYLANADFFLSMYDSSNVGNPLLEAIRSNKIIITLANGDTSDWIQHTVNGLIYDPKNFDFKSVALNIAALMDDKNLRLTITDNIAKTEREKLWTWEERLGAEVESVNNL
jgi:glycosyltransferase involved in cell wall biosynthesis